MNRQQSRRFIHVTAGLLIGLLGIVDSVVGETRGQLDLRLPDDALGTQQLSYDLPELNGKRQRDIKTDRIFNDRHWSKVAADFVSGIGYILSGNGSGLDRVSGPQDQGKHYPQLGAGGGFRMSSEFNKGLILGISQKGSVKGPDMVLKYNNRELDRRSIGSGYRVPDDE